MDQAQDTPKEQGGILENENCLTLEDIRLDTPKNQRVNREIGDAFIGWLETVKAQKTAQKDRKENSGMDAREG